jgi:hypothetical protein
LHYGCTVGCGLCLLRQSYRRAQENEPDATCHEQLYILKFYRVKNRRIRRGLITGIRSLTVAAQLDVVSFLHKSEIDARGELNLPRPGAFGALKTR